MKNIGPQKLKLPPFAPVMVLGGMQLFPDTLLPLYIFEPRYRAMLAWALEQDRMFCIATMKPGVTEARSHDDFFQIAGLGVVRACVGRPDGTSHLVLQGLARIEFTDFLQSTPFRIAELREVPEQPPEPDDELELLGQLRESCSQLFEEGGLAEGFDKRLLELNSLSRVTDLVAHAVVPTSPQRQILLETTDVGERARMLIALLRAYLDGQQFDE